MSYKITKSYNHEHSGSSIFCFVSIWITVAREGRTDRRTDGGREGGMEAERKRAHLKGVEHALACDDDLFGLLLHGQGADEGCHFLRSLPLRQLWSQHIRVTTHPGHNTPSVTHYV